MTDLPSLSDLVLALGVVALLFVVRAYLTLRRIGAGQDLSAGAVQEMFARAFRPAAFGAGREPERRSAVRQIYAAATFGTAALILSGWFVLASVLGPFLQRGFGG